MVMPYDAPNFWRRIVLLSRQPTWWAEVSVASSLTLWALLCMLSPNQMNRIAFHMLLNIAPEYVWERLALAAGAFHIVALFVSGSHPLLIGYNWRIAASLCSAWFISFLLISLVSARPIPPGTAFYLVPLCMDLLALAKNVRRTA